MKYIPLFILLLVSGCAFAQPTTDIVIGRVDSLQSKILNEKRKIWVHVPDGGSTELSSKQRYPVIYVLDGDKHFLSIVGMIEQLSRVNGNNVLPEMIVVGIPNTDRARDLTPTHIESDPPFMSAAYSKSTGGGSQFLAFIEKELIPHIDSLYPTQPYRTLVGHSFGGLAVLNSLINQPKLFNSYVCVDPSMWYDHMNFLKTTKKALSEKRYAGTTLYVGIANTMNHGMTLEKLANDTTSDTRHIRAIFDLDRHLKANNQTGLRYKSKYYPDDSHGSVPLITEYDALRFIFDFYSFKLESKDYHINSDVLAQRYAAHYTNASKQLGYKVAPLESTINVMGYIALEEKHYKTAESLFKLNIANYPESIDVYDSYADYCIAKKDTASAIVNLNKVLTLNAKSDSRKKLDELTGKKSSASDPVDLQKYEGEFLIESAAVTIKTVVRNGVLFMQATGRPESELEPTKRHEFKVKNMKDYTFRFELENDKPSALHVFVPEGTFTATVKK